MSGPQLYHRIEAVIEQCNIESLRHALIHTLSAGQRVHIAIADTLLHDPPVLLLDDSFAAIDIQSRQSLIHLLQRICSDKSLIMTTHLPDEAAPVCTHYALLKEGVLFEHAALPVLQGETFQQHFAARFVNEH